MAIFHNHDFWWLTVATSSAQQVNDHLCSSARMTVIHPPSIPTLIASPAEALSPLSWDQTEVRPTCIDYCSRKESTRFSLMKSGFRNEDLRCICRRVSKHCTPCKLKVHEFCDQNLAIHRTRLLLQLHSQAFFLALSWCAQFCEVSIIACRL